MCSFIKIDQTVSKKMSFKAKSNAMTIAPWPSASGARKAATELF